MNEPVANAQSVFARASQLPPGTSREDLVRRDCGQDSALRSEVESLLHAHDEAGGFLNRGVQILSQFVGENPGASSQGTTLVNPAAHAELFLRTMRESPQDPDQFVAGLPEDLRKEVRERISAGLRIRQIRGAPKGSVSGPVQEPVPRLPGFRIERKLGQGGLGIVYAAHDEKLNRPVAIKVLRHSQDGEAQWRVLNEARNTAALNDPAVVTVFSVLDETDPPAIVMELVQGFSLDRFAAQLNFEQKARLLSEVARALGVAHTRGLIHRDLKPDNVLVGPDMRPIILDFGLAFSLEEAKAQGRGFEGTPLYASPEQVVGKPLTPASDVFSFGSLMFKVLSGKAPFAGESVSQVLEAIATTAPPFLNEAAVGVPEDLQAICLACLAWNPADRPSAQDLVLELNRFLIGEPVRLRPKLYHDMLHRTISEYSNRAQVWESQGIMLREERDALEVLHRRLLSDEDYWIVDARRITSLQSILSAATWCSVVATILMVWMLREDLAPVSRWLLPTSITTALLVAGNVAHRKRENLAAATFLAGAALAIAPATLAVLAEIRLFATPAAHVRQLFEDTFTNQQVLAAAATALGVSVFSLRRFKMTGFAWTTTILGLASYISLLLLFDWLNQEPEIQALWCLPLVCMEAVALALERKGRVRWTLPFHLIALVALVAGLDVIASEGTTLEMLGLRQGAWGYFDEMRLRTASFLLNGLLFLSLMLIARSVQSLDLRRFAKWLELLAILHVLSALFTNAINHRLGEPYVRLDVWLYVLAAIFFTVLGSLLSRWRMLVCGLIGCGLGCYLLVHLELVARKPFIIGLGFAGLLIALGTFVYERARPRWRWPIGARKP